MAAGRSSAHRDDSTARLRRSGNVRRQGRGSLRSVSSATNRKRSPAAFRPGIFSVSVRAARDARSRCDSHTRFSGSRTCGNQLSSTRMLANGPRQRVDRVGLMSPRRRTRDRLRPNTPYFLRCCMSLNHNPIRPSRRRHTLPRRVIDARSDPGTRWSSRLSPRYG